MKLNPTQERWNNLPASKKIAIREWLQEVNEMNFDRDVESFKSHLKSLKRNNAKKAEIRNRYKLWASQKIKA